MKKYKGKGSHSVNQLELIIESMQEELHLLNSGQKKYTENDMDNAYDKGFLDGKNSKIYSNEN